MKDDRNLKPFMNIGPGVIIKDFLDGRGWSQEDLSHLTEISTKQLSLIINQKVRITIDTARLLGKAFETSAEFWVNLDTRYRLNLETDQHKENATERKAKIRKYMPVPEMLKKGWFDSDKTADGYESLFRDVWNQDQVNTCVYDNSDQDYCARQNNQDEEYTRFYSKTWLQVARGKAGTITVPDYDENLLKDIISGFTRYTVMKDGVEQIIKDLNKAGVKFFVLSHLSKTYLDGACFWNEGNPVIVFTGRYDRVDNFWFTLAHELAHVIKHLPNLKKDDYFLDDLKDGEAISDQEKEADKKAEELLRVNEIVDMSKPYVKYFSEVKLNQISKALGIESSVILGVLQHKKLVEYRKMNKYKKKVIELIPSNFILG